MSVVSDSHQFTIYSGSGVYLRPWLIDYGFLYLVKDGPVDVRIGDVYLKLVVSDMSSLFEIFLISQLLI